jgi:hypothetical protein
MPHPHRLRRNRIQRTDYKLNDRSFPICPTITTRSGDPYPPDLIGAKVIGFGTTAERIKRVEGGGLVIDYKPPQSETVKRLHLGFNETHVDRKPMSSHLLLPALTNVPPVFGTSIRPYLYGVGLLTAKNSTENTTYNIRSAVAASRQWTRGAGQVPMSGLSVAGMPGTFASQQKAITTGPAWTICSPGATYTIRRAASTLRAGTTTPQWVYDSGAIKYYTHAVIDDESFTDGVSATNTTWVSATPSSSMATTKACR